jgi:hypothetical protein
MGAGAAAVRVTNQRAQVRYSITGRVTATLETDGGGALTFFPVDISVNGMGVLLDVDLPRGSLVAFLPEAAGEAVLLRVVWGFKAYDSLDVYRFGLRVVDPGVDLVALVGAMRTVQLTP